MFEGRDRDRPSRAELHGCHQISCPGYEIAGTVGSMRRMTICHLIRVVRDARWLTRDRVIAWGIVLLIEEFLLVLFAALWLHGVFVEIKVPSSSDFVSFYAAGKLTLAGTPASVYDQAAHHLAEQQATVAGVPYMLFIYPPVFLFLCAGLARLPYLVAFALFEVVTLALFVMVMRGVLREKGWQWIAPLLAFPAVFWTIGLGQNAFLTGALLGGFTLLIDGRPILAGVLLGMACYKPHFALLAPVALVAGRHWRAFWAASVTTAGLIATSVVVFGWDTWQAYIVAFAGSLEIYASGRIAFAGIVTPFSAVRMIGFNSEYAYAFQSIATVMMAGLVAIIWRRGTHRAIRGASLLVATLLAVPLALIYDMLLALVAVGWLVREAREHGFLPWEKIVMLATYPMSLMIWTAATVYHIPLGPLITLTILSLCVRRVVATAGGSEHSAPIQDQTGLLRA
jgi:alpha-1,2-mannosyltransferase